MIDPTLRESMNGLIQGKLPWPLFVYGPIGTGKTCAGLVLVDHAGGFFYTASEWARLLNEANNGMLFDKVDQEIRKVSPQTLWNGISKAKLVVIDELGARIDAKSEKVSEHAYESIKELIDLRYGKPLVLLSNLTLPQVAKVYDERVVDRIAAGTIVNLQGKSRRTGQ